MVYFTSDLELPNAVDCNEQDKLRVDDIIQHFNFQAPQKSDLIVSVGDFLDSEPYNIENAMSMYNYYVEQLKASIFNVEGNHEQDKVFSIAPYLKMRLGGKVDVFVQHKPIEDDGDGTDLRRFCERENIKICICGHVHNAWKYNFNEAVGVLNINVGIDSWGYKLISEFELLDYIYKVDSKYHLL